MDILTRTADDDGHVRPSGAGKSVIHVIAAPAAHLE